MNATLRQFDALEIRTCRRINRWSSHTAIRRFFATVSRLGDGAFWYVLVIAMVLRDGWQAGMPVVKMTLAAVTGIVLYKALKHRLVRERPFVSYKTITCGTPPLDRYSFPSGHTLHAVNFSVLLAHFVPGSLFITAPFAVLVALSRVVLGLHYPTDVAAGALLGATIATITLQF